MFLCACGLQVICLQRAELSRETVYPMHPSSIRGVEDMSTLAELHEAAIMHNLLLRYQKDNIYVSCILTPHSLVPGNWNLSSGMCRAGRLCDVSVQLKHTFPQIF